MITFKQGAVSNPSSKVYIATFYLTSDNFTGVAIPFIAVVLQNANANIGVSISGPVGKVEVNSLLVNRTGGVQFQSVFGYFDTNKNQIMLQMQSTSSSFITSAFSNYARLISAYVICND